MTGALLSLAAVALALVCGWQGWDRRLGAALLAGVLLLAVPLWVALLAPGPGPLLAALVGGVWWCWLLALLSLDALARGGRAPVVLGWPLFAALLVLALQQALFRPWLALAPATWAPVGFALALGLALPIGAAAAAVPLRVGHGAPRLLLALALWLVLLLAALVTTGWPHAKWPGSLAASVPLLGTFAAGLYALHAAFGATSPRARQAATLAAVLVPVAGLLHLRWLWLPA